jgi:flagellin-like hook-associated protein FlgL
VSTEEFQSAESHIRDLDFAGEMMNFVSNLVLKNTGLAMVAQANTLV